MGLLVILDKRCLKYFRPLHFLEILTENFAKFGFQDILVNKPYFCKYQADCTQILMIFDILTISEP